ADGSTVGLELRPTLRNGKMTVSLGSIASPGKPNDPSREPVMKTDDQRDLQRFVGCCVHLRVDGTRKQRNEMLARQREAPAANVGGPQKTRVSSSPESKYFVELRAGPRGGKSALRPRAATIKGGIALAILDLDEEYEVWIHNETDQEAACRAYVDGVD